MRVHDWDQWQSYRKDRGQPPWIKVHRCLMRDVKWVSLGSHERGDLVSLWLLAADNNGVIPDDPKLLQRLCYLDHPPNINKFLELGLLESDGQPRDANVTPPRRQCDVPEVEAEVEAEVEVEKEVRGKTRKRFSPPTPSEVSEYGSSIEFNIDGNHFCDFYASKGWMVGKNKMKDWKAAVRTWKVKANPGARSSPGLSIAELQAMAKGEKGKP